jgi:hypothetical protein
MLASDASALMTSSLGATTVATPPVLYPELVAETAFVILLRVLLKVLVDGGAVAPVT